MSRTPEKKDKWPWLSQRKSEFEERGVKPKEESVVIGRYSSLVFVGSYEAKANMGTLDTSKEGDKYTCNTIGGRFDNVRCRDARLDQRRFIESSRKSSEPEP